MNIRYLEILTLLSALLFLSQGCSFYARLGSLEQSPQSKNKIAAGIEQGETMAMKEGGYTQRN